jgi:uncharacterized repeat protein (TIGR01451 family)
MFTQKQQHIFKNLTYFLCSFLAVTFIVSTFFFIQNVQAATYVVTNNADSGAGSLRDAMEQSELNPGADIITFNLPSGQTEIQPSSPLPEIYGDLQINANTQPGYTGVPIVEVNGVNAGAGVDGFRLFGSNISIRGLSINGYSADGIYAVGSQIVVEGNHLGLRPDGITARSNGRRGIYIQDSNAVTIGGLTTSTKNVISGNGEDGVFIIDSTNITLQNNFIGTNAIGSTGVGNAFSGITIDSDINPSSNITIGRDVPNGGNLISGNIDSGVNILDQSTNVRIYNNIIGLNAAQNATLPNGDPNSGFGAFTAGIYSAFGVSDITIGGSSANQRNIISGNTGDGVYLGNDNDGAIVQNNIIGTNPSNASALGNGKNGIMVYSAVNQLIGGIGSNVGNILANNGQHGVAVEVGVGGGGLIDPVNVPILGNSTFGNGRLGINLENIAENANFIDPNDNLDIDTGPNGLQNSPVISGRTINSSDITVNGTLNSNPTTNFRIELFATNPSINIATDREGTTFIGSANIVTDGSGNANWTITVPIANENFAYMATATSFIPGGGQLNTNVGQLAVINGNNYMNTSEFGALNFPNATITKTHNQPNGAAPGDSVTYTVNIQNTTSTPLSNGVVTDVLDPNLTYSSGTCAPNVAPITCSFNSGTNTLTWNISSLAPNSTTNLSFQATINTNTPNNVTNINNTAVLTAPNISAESSTTGLGINHPGVQLQKTHNRSTGAQPGETVTYSINATNSSQTILNNVVVTDVLDPNLTYSSGTCAPNVAPITCSFNSGTNTLTWNISSIALGSNVSLTFEATVNPNLPTNINSIGNTAILTATNLSAQSSTIGLGINRPGASNTLNILADKPQINSGENITYNITYTNDGQITLNNVQVTAQLDPNVEFVSCSNGCIQNGQTLTWNVASMNAGASSIVSVTVKALSGFVGNVTTTSQLTANELPVPKTQSVSTTVLNIATLLPRTGGINLSFQIIFSFVAFLGIWMLRQSLKSEKRKIPVRYD